MQQDRPRKLQRISQACKRRAHDRPCHDSLTRTGDLCHRRSIRCRPSNEDGERCQNCYDFDVGCTYDRPSKRRKHPQAPTAPQQSARSSQSRSTLTSGDPSSVNTGRNDSVGKANEFGPVPSLQPTDGDVDALELSWKAFSLSSENVILDLFDVYMEVVYPLYAVVVVSVIYRFLTVTAIPSSTKPRSERG